MAEKANITIIRQDYARSGFEKFARTPNEFDLIVDEIKVGTLKIDARQATFQIPSGRHSIYLRTPEGYYGAGSNIPNGKYDLSKTLQIQLFEGEHKTLVCGSIQKPGAQRLLMGTMIIATLVLLCVPVSALPGNISEQAKHFLVVALALAAIALAWYGHSSTAGSEIFLAENYDASSR